MLIKVFSGLASKIDQIRHISRSYVLKILSYAQKTFFLHINEETLALSHLSKNYTKTHPSSEPKETQQPPNLKRKISLQESVKPSKYPRKENVTQLIQTIMNNFSKTSKNKKIMTMHSLNFQNDMANHGVMMNN